MTQESVFDSRKCYRFETGRGTIQPPIRTIRALFLREVKQPERVAGHPLCLIMTCVCMCGAYRHSSIGLHVVILSDLPLISLNLGRPIWLSCSVRHQVNLLRPRKCFVSISAFCQVRTCRCWAEAVGCPVLYDTQWPCLNVSSSFALDLILQENRRKILSGCRCAAKLHSCEYFITAWLLLQSVYQWFVSSPVSLQQK